MTTSSEAEEDLITGLLSMPAPPPPNPLVRNLPSNPEWTLDKRNPPKDDAPIGELMEYWSVQSSRYSETVYSIMPSQRSLDRIRAEIEKDPASIVSYVNLMRDSRDGAEFVKRIHDNWPADAGEEEDGRATLKNWLKMNSSYFSSQLEKTANAIGEQNEYVNNQDELLALAKHDWNAARPTVDRLYGDTGQPVSRVLAAWALYRHAVNEDSMGDIDRYREELKAIVEDKKATAGMRDLAMDALVREKEWNGRDEWYFSLLEDETLGELRVNGSLYTGLTTLINASPPDKYADKMIEFVKSTNPAVRNVAARNLAVILERDRPDVVRALLPWLEDPKWAKDLDNSRQKLVTILQSVKIPESVPGLIAVLDEKETVSYPLRNAASNSNTVSNIAPYAGNSVVTANRTANSANMAANAMRTVSMISHPLRSEAIAALAMQGDMRAAPVLRRILREVEGYERNALVRAILMCKGFTVMEQADALESYVKTIKERVANAAAYANAVNTAANAMNPAADAVSDAMELRSERYTLSNSNVTRAASPIDPDELKVMIAMQLLQIEEPGDPLVREIVARISLLEKKEAETAETLRQVLLVWKGTAINALLLKDLKDNKSNPLAVLKLLGVRKELREKQQSDVFDIRTSNPTATGISACLLESEPDYASILNGENVEAKAALLACGRLIRAKIPIAEAAKLLSSKDKRLAAAAEAYLESEDSPEARSIVLSMHPNEAKILGATTGFWPEARTLNPSPLVVNLFESVGGSFAGRESFYSLFGSQNFKDDEKRLQTEIKAETELFGIYAYEDNFIRIYKDKSVYSWIEDDSRYRERTLDKEEFNELTGYLTHNKVDEMAPFLSCRGECQSKQLLMLGKHGGRRVFVNSTRQPEFFADLEAMFKNMRHAPAKLRYNLEKEIPGLEILYADADLSALTVWKNGSDLRLLVADKVKGKQIESEITEAREAFDEGNTDEESDNPAENKVLEILQKRAFENYSWFKLGSGGLGDPTAQPAQVEFIPIRDSFSIPAASGQWKAKAAGVEIRADSAGLHKIAGGRIALIRSGYYDSPVVTANGKWVIATKYSEDDGPQLYRINLLTGKEFPVVSEDFPARRAIAFVPSVNKVLTTGVAYEEYEEYASSESYGGTYWVDPETGAVQPTAGEIQPLAQQKFRSLQPAENAFEFWAAIRDARKGETRVGIYNSRTFTFKPTLTVPKINFNSMHMWVDVPAGKVYFVYSGHLLALPLGARK
ncbi:MAG: hypothetical protein ABIU09_11570 [Pyrinomonadaceae bacterium]